MFDGLVTLPVLQVRRIKSDAETELASARFQVKEAAQAQVSQQH
jgi:hypothetical protein